MVAIGTRLASGPRQERPPFSPKSFVEHFRFPCLKTAVEDVSSMNGAPRLMS